MSDQSVREHVLDLLKGGGAHLGFEQAIAGLPEELRGAKVDGVPHTPWRLLEPTIWGNLFSYVDAWELGTNDELLCC